MTAELVSATLLAVVVLIAALSVFGLVRHDSVYDRLHFSGPVAVICPLLVTLAVLAWDGPSINAVKALLTALVLAVTTAVLNQATAHAATARGEDRPS